MSVNLSLLFATGVLFGAGAFMLMERSLTRVLLGFLLLGNGANLLLLQMGGPAGEAPISELGAVPNDVADPLVQALILTAIVITFAAAAFVLALIYRSWSLANVDLVTDDVEDRLVGSSESRASEEAAGPQQEPELVTEFGPAEETQVDGEVDDRERR